LKTTYHTPFILIVIFAISLFFQFKTLNEFPQYKHNWAQCDRYALSLGFINNGGDFFHPETFIYNNQFPEGNFGKIRETTITSVDFPIHDYLVSVIMRIFNTQDPWCFRLYAFLYSITGLFFLYRLASLFTDSFAISLCVVLFAASSPVFLYYQAGFLPTIPSLANCIIAIFFLFRFYKNGNEKDYYLSVFFITLAALSRLPFAIFLVAIMCMEILEIIRSRQIRWFKWIAFTISLFLIGGYYIYNSYLRSEHGSLFLNYIMPAGSIDEVLEFTYATYERWTFKYFTPIHYILLLFTGSLFISNKIVNRIILPGLDVKLVVFCLILFVGCICYYLLMTFQYLDHDYYFLDTFYLPFVLLFLLFATTLFAAKKSKSSILISVIILSTFVPALLYANSVQESEKNSSNLNGEKSTAGNFENADRFLDSLRIPENSRILVMGADGPNNPFILMKRKGYALIYPDQGMITNALKWPYDYVVIEDSKLISSIYPAYPGICNDLSKINGNNNISVFVKNTVSEQSDFDTFFNLHESKIKYKQRISFDTIPGNCSGVDSLSSFCFSGKKSGFINANCEYGFCTWIANHPALNRQSSVLKVQAQFASPESVRECLVCVSIKSKEEDILFLANDISHFDINEKWSKHAFLFDIPKIEEKEYEMKIFVWNIKKSRLFYDDFEIIIYQ